MHGQYVSFQRKSNATRNRKERTVYPHVHIKLFEQSNAQNILYYR